MNANASHPLTSPVSLYAFTMDEDSDPIVDVVTDDVASTLAKALHVAAVTLSPLFHDDYTEDDVYSVLDASGARIGSAYINEPAA